MKQFSFLRLKGNLFSYFYQKYANNCAGKKDNSPEVAGLYPKLTISFILPETTKSFYTRKTKIFQTEIRTSWNIQQKPQGKKGSTKYKY